MNNKKGFSLLLFLLYICFFSGVSLYLCQTITTLILPTIIQTNEWKNIIRLHIASDLFFRDIKAIKEQPVIWNKVSEKEAIWSLENYSIGWAIKDNQLERKEGLYRNNEWKSGITSVITDKIETGSFSLEKNEDSIIAIKLELIPYKSNKVIECYVFIPPNSTQKLFHEDFKKIYKV